MKQVGIFLFLVLFFAGFYLFHAHASDNFLYFELPWLDIPMHFLGGFGLGLGALWVYFFSGLFTPQINHRSTHYVLFLAILSALVLGGVWEVYEYGMDIYHERLYSYDIYDTLSDFFFDAVGGTLAAVFFIIFKAYQSNYDR